MAVMIGRATAATTAEVIGGIIGGIATTNVGITAATIGANTRTTVTPTAGIIGTNGAASAAMTSRNGGRTSGGAIGSVGIAALGTTAFRIPMTRNRIGIAIDQAALSRQMTISTRATCVARFISRYQRFVIDFCDGPKADGRFTSR